MREKKSFIVSYSTLAKGVGVLLLLLHHSLYESYSFVSIIPGEYLRHIVSIGKICVSVFFILSGYGMYMSFTKSKRDMKKSLQFFGKHVLKLLLNFWFVYLVFVSIGLFLGRSFNDIYGSHTVVNSILDFMGSSAIFATPSANNTWWYISYTILFYCISPLLFKLIERLKNYNFVVFAILCITSMFYYGYRNVLLYFIPYFLGAILAQLNGFENLYNSKIIKECIKQVVIVIVSVTLVVIRQTILAHDLGFYKLDFI